jgi:hypothetical protein
MGPSENAAHSSCTTRKCSAHLAHTAEYRSTINPLLPLLSNSYRQMLRVPNAHCRIQKHRQHIDYISVRLAMTRKCCTHLTQTEEYRSTSDLLVPFLSSSQQPGNIARSECTLQNIEAHATHWIHFGQTRNSRKSAAHS